MSISPYIVYPDTESVEAHLVGVVVSKQYINEPGQVIFGVIDYLPGWFIALHHHHVWELIIIDNSSEGPGYVFFDRCWWKVKPGSGVFIPRGYSHAWSAGSKGFKMLWVYGGETTKIYDVDPESFSPITPEEEESSSIWTTEAGNR